MVGVKRWIVIEKTAEREGGSVGEDSENREGEMENNGSICEGGHEGKVGNDERLDGGGGGWSQDADRGDFNARMGRLGGKVRKEEEKEEEEGRMSKDGKVNGERKLLVERLEEIGWALFNGGMKRNMEGNWTYVGAGGQSVMDYVMGNGNVWERVERFEVMNRVESNHMRIMVWVKEDVRSEKRKYGREEKKGGGNGRMRKKRSLGRSWERYKREMESWKRIGEG